MAPREKSQLKRVRVRLTRRNVGFQEAAPVGTDIPQWGTSQDPRHQEPTTTPFPGDRAWRKQQFQRCLQRQNSNSPSPGGPPSQIAQRSPEETYSQNQGISSPPQDTQAFPSQLIDQQAALSDQVEDEVKEGVWGYLFPLDTQYGRCVVLRKRAACPMPDAVSATPKNKETNETRALQQEESYEKEKAKGVPAGGYLIGRHQECDVVVNEPIVSNRHTLIFTENKGSDAIAVLEDLSSNGTFVNEDLVGRDPALDLIDSMLVVEPEKRFSVDQCLSHPWITQHMPGVNDSTDGLVAGIGGLDVKRRGMARERTLLSSINSVTVAHEVPLGPKQKKDQPLKVYAKNQHSHSPTNVTPMEVRPADKRDAKEFMEMGGKGDQELFGNDGESYYTKAEAAAATGKAKDGTKVKANGDVKDDAKAKGKAKAGGK
ncbi:serine/threonine-protein kinase fhkC [Apiospora kogelbergensis]|uniref:serine/threonine-protein kinase fhkC n=1 Tax=Apiospora kogelbergensis TaxID=1337665 RepID=UPI00312DD629